MGSQREFKLTRCFVMLSHSPPPRRGTCSFPTSNFKQYPHWSEQYWVALYEIQYSPPQLEPRGMSSWIKRAPTKVVFWPPRILPDLDVRKKIFSRFFSNICGVPMGHQHLVHVSQPCTNGDLKASYCTSYWRLYLHFATLAGVQRGFASDECCASIC